MGQRVSLWPSSMITCLHKTHDGSKYCTISNVCCWPTSLHFPPVPRHGSPVPRTMGSSICRMTPSRGFCVEWSSSLTILLFTVCGIQCWNFKTICRARNWVGIGLLYWRPARLHRLAEYIPWDWFWGSFEVYKFGLRIIFFKITKS